MEEGHQVHILLLVGELRLIPFSVDKEELAVCEEVLHGGQCRIRNGIADGFVAIPEGIFCDSGGVNGVILPSGEAHGVLDAGGIIHPEEDVQFLAGYGQRVDVSSGVLGADEGVLKSCSKHFQRCFEGLLEVFYIVGTSSSRTISRPLR